VNLFETQCSWSSEASLWTVRRSAYQSSTTWIHLWNQNHLPGVNYNAPIVDHTPAPPHPDEETLNWDDASDDRSNDSRREYYISIRRPNHSGFQRQTRRSSCSPASKLNIGLYLQAGRTSLCDVIMTSNGGATLSYRDGRRYDRRRWQCRPRERGPPAFHVRAVPAPAQCRNFVAMDRRRWPTIHGTARLGLQPFTSSAVRPRPSRVHG